MLMAKDRFYRCRMEVEIFLPHSKSTSALNDIRAGVLFISKQTKNKFINWSFKGRQTKHDFKRWTRQRRDLIPVSRSTHHSKHPLKCVKSPFTIFFFIFLLFLLLQRENGFLPSILIDQARENQTYPYPEARKTHQLADRTKEIARNAQSSPFAGRSRLVIREV